jgi:hypothetical protein
VRPGSLMTGATAETSVGAACVSVTGLVDLRDLRGRADFVLCAI